MSRVRYRFGTKHRDEVWACETLAAYKDGRGTAPICNLCDEPVALTDPWDISHVGAPKALGGKRAGVGHRDCNRRDNNLVVTPMVARAKRLAAIAAGLRGPGLGRYPMRGGRFSTETKTFGRGVQRRMTLAQKHKRMLELRAIVMEGVAP